MSTTLFVKRSRETPNALTAIDKITQEAFQLLPYDRIFKVEITQPRNSAHHRKFFALLHVVYHSLPDRSGFPTMDTFLTGLKIALGLVDIFETASGDKYPVPRSISFAKMNQDQFTEFYDSVVNLILSSILPGLNREDLERQIAEIIDGISL